jgi:polar amino acid transport system substrate-binding protein
MRKLIAILLAGIFILTACNVPAAETKIRVLSEEYPPFNYTDGKGNFTGTSTEVVKSVMSKLGVNIPIEVMTWDKSYDVVQKEPGAALFSMARSPEREHLFMWVGPIGSYENWLYAKKGSSVKVSSLEEARAVRKIAAVKDEAGQIKLAQQGFINFEITATTPDGVKKLMSGDVDLWLGTKDDLDLVAKNAGINPDDLEPAVFVHKLDLYLAFNKNTPFATVDAWQKALDSLKK